MHGNLYRGFESLSLQKKNYTNSTKFRSCWVLQNCIYLKSRLFYFFAIKIWIELVQDGLHSCPAVLELRKSLEAEREVVLNFLFTAMDEVLTPAQESYLDIRSYPWCPDIWAIVQLMAERRKVAATLHKYSVNKHPLTVVLHFTYCSWGFWGRVIRMHKHSTSVIKFDALLQDSRSKEEVPNQ